jgi:choline dehydrogenase
VLTVDGDFDYIIVGGGTAGCVLADRLTADGTARVLLLEAGPPATSLWISMPAGMGRLFVNPRYNWGFLGQPEPTLGGRELYFPQGRVLGGSSAINGMAFVRGQPQDYDGWRVGGATGWGWGDVLPYFERLEDRCAAPGRGQGGRLSVSDPCYVHGSAHAFCAAAHAAGAPDNPDYNGAVQEGAGLLQFTIRDGRRDSAASAYLSQARMRRNLKVLTSARATEILFEGRKAVGVAFEHGGATRIAPARGEVIVASGAIGSPHLLLRSGLGDGAELAALDIAPIASLPQVGRNLADHPYVHMTFGVRPGASLNPLLRGWRAYLQGARWLFTRRGPLTIGASQAVAFVRSGPNVTRPDLQINFRPISHAFDSAGRLGPDPTNRVTAAICGLRPASRGRVWLQSPDGPPAVLGGYLEDATDEEVLVSGIDWVRRIFASEPLRSLVLAEDKPGSATLGDRAVRQFVRETVQTMCHPVGTCRMGSDEGAVVDPRLRVRGVGGLRVVDSSIMPSIVSGNTVAATYMIAEKASDMIRADRRARRGVVHGA